MVTSIQKNDSLSLICIVFLSNPVVFDWHVVMLWQFGIASNFFSRMKMFFCFL